MTGDKKRLMTLRLSFGRNQPQQRANLGFLAMLGMGGLWLLISLNVIWHYAGQFFNFLYYICHRGWEIIVQQLPGGLYLIIPLLIIGILSRGVFLFVKRLRQTGRFKHTIQMLHLPPSGRLLAVARQAGLQVRGVYCFQSQTARAFSLGIWQPQVWISSRLLDMLEDDELLAVLQHEAHHCRQRDPLRLLISRLISDIFFFVPLVWPLADYVQLAQEVAADASAIEQVGTRRPLASALHKLLTTPEPVVSPPDIAISQINVTERRIMALVSPDQDQRWRPTFPRWLISLLLAGVLLGSTSFAQPNKHQLTLTCSITQAAPYHHLSLPAHPDVILPY
jgi:Zn-dependent protease with chaperone function